MTRAAVARMPKRLPASTFFALLLVIAGCSTGAPPAEDRAGSSSAEQVSDTPEKASPNSPASPDQSSSSCGNYESKQCDPQIVIDYVKSHPVDDTISNVFGCGDCGAALAAAGLITVGAVEAPPVAIGIGSAFAVLKSSSDCQQCLKFSEESGIAEVLSCAVAPCKYSEEGNQKDCEQSAPEGQFGFKNRGNVLCSYTSDPVEAECRLKCFDGTHIIKEDNGRCWCKAD
jgi:hypothetical protein